MIARLGGVRGHVSLNLSVPWFMQLRAGSGSLPHAGAPGLEANQGANPINTYWIASERQQQQECPNKSSSNNGGHNSSNNGGSNSGCLLRYPMYIPVNTLYSCTLHGIVSDMLPKIKN